MERGEKTECVVAVGGRGQQQVVFLCSEVGGVAGAARAATLDGGAPGHRQTPRRQKSGGMRRRFCRAQHQSPAPDALMSAPLHHGCARVPVTALALAGRFVLAADGPILRVFLRHGSECLFSEQIFKNQAVHGLVVIQPSAPTCSTVIAYGGPCVRLVRVAQDESTQKFTLDRGPVARVSDWVLDLAHPFYELDRPPSSAGDAANLHATSTVAVTAHNALVRLHWTSTSPSGFSHEAPVLTAHDVTASSRCILYSAHLSWLSAAKVLVASGTAFGEILVWSCDFSDLSAPKSCVHHFFTGHEGSIFGVQISPPLSLRASESPPCRLLASCSDDRTVRLWDISLLPDGDALSTSDDALGLVQDRETGFGANVSSADENCLAVAWGHTSRVWAVRFVGHSFADGIHRLVSFGEDATSRVWGIDCRSSEGGQLPGLKVSVKLLSTSALHSGKNIWAMDIAPSSGDDSFETVTGAADGAITSHVWPLEPLESVSPQPTADAHRCCSFVSEQLVVSATNSGKIIRGSPAAAGETNGFVWEVVGQVDELRGYSVSAGLPDWGIAFLAGSGGSIYCYQESTRACCIATRVSRKVSGLFASHFRDSRGKGLISLVVTTVGAKTAECFIFSRNSDTPELALMQKTVLELPRAFVVTSALYVATSDQTIIFLGARSGLVSAYESLPLGADPAVEIYQHTTIHELHAPETVTSLSWIPSEPVRDNARLLGHLLSVGRDGRSAATKIHSDRPAIIAHRLSLPFGPNAEGCYIEKGNLIVYGFRGKNFVVVNASTEQELFSVECGGAHRIWSFCPAGSGRGGTFVWNQASTLKLFSIQKISHKVIRSGGHGREIKAATACPGGSRIVATGAEDTTIRLFEYAARGNALADFHCVRVMRKHVTGIQHLAWSEDGRFLFSSGGYEEFFVWRIRKLPVVGVGAICEAVCPPESELPDLRIMGFATQQRNSDEQADGEQDAEFLITMVYSDSTVRTYSYTSTPTLKKFELLQVGAYLTSCLTQSTYLTPSLLLTAGTDGHIAFWPLPPVSLPPTASDDLPATISFTTRHKIHQSTVKALAWTRLSTTTLLLLTGGDDNALAFSLVRLPGGRSEEQADAGVENGGHHKHQPIVSTLLVPRAHAATITALALVRPSSQDIDVCGRGDGGGRTHTFLAVSSGSDQRVKVWEVRVDGVDLDADVAGGAGGVDGLDVRKVADRVTAVADVADVTLLAAGSSAQPVELDSDGGNAKGDVDVDEAREKREPARAAVLVVVAGVGLDSWMLEV